VFAADQSYDLWLGDLGPCTLPRASLELVPSFPSVDDDGRSLLFSSERAGTMNLYSQAADGTSAVER
jgi:Tol biopolymer transport system component